MSKDIYVSVIIPVYNVEKYLKECLDSVTNQTLKEIEIICVDDGSTDNSLSILEEYAKKDERITIIKQQNEGAGIARNKGLDIAKGEYIHFLDSDDTIALNFYELLYSTAIKNSSDIVICNINVVSDKISYVSEYFNLNPYFNGKSNLNFNYKAIEKHLFRKSWNIWNKIYKNSFINDKKIRFCRARIFHDGPFHFKTITKAKSVAYINEKLYNYNVNPYNLTTSSNDTEIVFDFFIALDEIVRAFKDNNLYNKYKLQIVSLILNQLNYRYNKISRIDIKDRFGILAANYIQNIVPVKKLKKLNKDIQEIYFKFMNLKIKQEVNKEISLWGSNIIPIVFSTNNNYAYSLATTIASLISHSNSHVNYVLYILYSELNEKNIFKLQSMSTSNVKIYSIDISSNSFFDNDLFTSGHISEETYYRLLIPTLFSQYNKIIYLDCDLVIKTDIANLYNENIENYLLGAVVNTGNIDYSKYRTEVLKVREDKYFNAGVLLINIDEFIKNRIIDKCKDLLKEIPDPKSHDQDILNVACKDKVRLLDAKWNFQWGAVVYKGIKHINVKKYKLFSKDKPYIIHYTTSIKPINIINRWSLVWWYYLGKTPYLKKYIKRLFKLIILSNKIFSITKSGDKKHKIITVLGLKFKIKRKKFIQQERIKNLEQQMKDFEQQIIIESNRLIKEIQSISNILEREQMLYHNPFETITRNERGLCDITSTNNFENRFLKLIQNLTSDDVDTIVKIIKRLQLIKGCNQKLDLFTNEEKIKLKEVEMFFKSILQISKNIWCYKNYLLPINHFEPSVFFYKHGLNNIENISYIKDKAIIDIGAFIGDSALIFSPLTNDKVYCFEAMSENYNNMLKTIKLNNLNNVVPIKTAIGAKNTEIEIRFNEASSSIDEIMVKSPKYIEKCKVISLDNWVKENKVNIGLIKVDIEGAEQDFLKGAINTIKKQRPIMLISIYHNVDDFLDIKPLIESWNLGYKFKIFKPVISSISGETLLICEPNDN